MQAPRTATRADLPAVAGLMRRSTLDLFPLFHSPEETASAAEHLTRPDTAVVDDGTYYVVERDGQLAACGGWSLRAKLYTGSGDRAGDDRLLDPATEPARVRAMFVHPDHTRRGLARALLDASRDAAAARGFRSLVLMSTLPGVPLYRAYGFEEVREAVIPLPDGVVLGGVEMVYRLDRSE